MRKLLQIVVTTLAMTATLLAPAASAQEFAAVVSPPRFEISVNPGERTRQVVEITNASAQSSTYSMRTADWTLAPDASVAFIDELAPGSCRPWVAIERREITIPGNGRYRFRFELEPPAGTAAGECRFALMIEGAEQTVRTAGGLNVPITGRIAVIVYASIGEAAPDLQVVGLSIADVNGRPLPVLNVTNTGNAHGRLAGFLYGTDAQGRKLEFSPSTLPILPGETRAIALAASDGSDAVVEVAYPVTITGTLEWGDARRVEINQLFTR